MRAICLDLFHTLVDVGAVPLSEGAFTADILGLDHEAWNAACFGAHHEIRRPTDHLEVIRRLARSLDPEIPETRIRLAAEARQRRFAHALRNPPQTTLHLVETLAGRGWRLCLVSNASSGEVAAWEQSPLARWFHTALFSCHCGVAKPDPAIYHLAAERLGTPPERCWFVGDGGSRELEGARGVGMRPLRVQWFRDRGQSGAAAEVVAVREVEELLGRVGEPAP